MVRFQSPSMMPLIGRVMDQSFHPDIFTMAKHFWNFLSFYLAAACVLPVQASDSMAFTETGAFRHHPSIRIELIAAEPDVVDPVALCFDASGNMYVVEMRDYPYGKGPSGSPGGTIRKLTFDASGNVSASHLYAERLSFPTSIAPYKDGVIIAAGDLIFLRDTDGDHIADVRQTLLTGFNQGVTDSNLSGLRWGLDGRLHGVNGGNNGIIYSPQSAADPLALRNADFAWNPLTGRVSRTYHTGGGFGLIFDRFGRSFTPHNINHILQRILPVKAMERFPGFPSIKATSSISDHGGMARIYPISTAQTRVNHPEQAGYFSSSGGMGLIPGTFTHGSLVGGVLVCDVVGNLVHRDVMYPKGPILEARRAPEEQSHEFIASRDLAFRPVGLETGPDGHLYLMDMQRGVIEHPDYIPEQIMGNYRIREGADRGRIYRVASVDETSYENTNLASATHEELVAHLGHENDWVRGTAHRLIVERQATTNRSSFKEAIASGSITSRIHALWCMNGLGMTHIEDVQLGLNDQHPEVRVQSLKILEKHPEWWNQAWPVVQSMAQDPDAEVRFHIALILGCHPHPDNEAALIQILITDIQYKWSRRAVYTSLRKNPTRLLYKLWQAYPDDNAGHDYWNDCINEVAYLTTARLDEQNIASFAHLLSSIDTGQRFTPSNALMALLDGAQMGAIRASLDKGIRKTLKTPLENLADESNNSVKRSVWKLSKALGLNELPGFKNTLKSSLITAKDNTKPLSVRTEAIALLGLGTFHEVGQALLELLNGLEPNKIQKAVISQLGRYSEKEVAQGILSQWREIGPGLRPLIIQTLLRRKEFHLPLMNAIENGQIALGELNLDLEQRRLLRKYSSKEVKEKATSLFGDEEYSNRKILLDEWLTRLPAKGNLTKGRQLFIEHCAQCHQSGNLGVEVGPNLTDMSHRSVEDLAFNILDPNMAINPSFVAYEAETKDGEFLSGIVQSETPESVTLLSAQGMRREVARSNLRHFRSGGLSLMPEGLEELMTPSELRDLIRFLQTSD
ncbi:MAG: c-type cytochrome [Verrucomicrobia bacterium]|nr:c-type cytochrome [Verrucomicrobiota bacterium]